MASKPTAETPSSAARTHALHDDALVKSHVEKEFTDVCGYCGKPFQKDEVQVVRTLHGREWRFCSEHCLREFHDAVDFKDEELDDEERGGVVIKQDSAYDD